MATVTMPSALGADTASARADALFREHHDKLVLVLQSRYGVQRELAEDACSYAWVQYLRYRPSRKEVGGWLYTVARNQLITLLTRRAREMPGCRIRLDGTTDNLHNVVELHELLGHFAQLKRSHRQVLTLRMAGHSYEAIAEVTGHTHTWVNRQLADGRQALRELLDP